MRGPLRHAASYVFFDKNGLGYILGVFFTNSSSHPGSGDKKGLLIELLKRSVGLFLIQNLFESLSLSRIFMG
jgi:hypothetical protein